MEKDLEETIDRLEEYLETNEALLRSISQKVGMVAFELDKVSTRLQKLETILIRRQGNAQD
jgi:uncharacterized coiled-coil protein SlyX